MFGRSGSTAPLHLAEDDRTAMHLGVDTRGRPICLDPDMLCEHMLVTGSTGSGKTEFLMAAMTHAFAWGTGGIYIDGKGDIAVMHRLVSVAKEFDKLDDLYILNFSAASFVGDEMSKLTHRFNPFAFGSGEVLSTLMVDLMDDAGPDGAMWKGRASAMIYAVLRALVWIRDEKKIPFGVQELRDSISLRSIIDLANPERFPDMPYEVRRGLTSYLKALPGFQADKGYRQYQTTLDQHGYLEMQFTKILLMLEASYRHIFSSSITDIDLEDVIRNRRYLLILLPALQKSAEEIAWLGKIVLASIRIIASNLIGHREKEALVETGLVQPDRSARPFLCVMDECTYYMVGGMSLLCAQARSLRISLMFAAQDIETMEMMHPAAASAILSNTRTKIVMRSDGGMGSFVREIVGAEYGRDDVGNIIEKAGRQNLLQRFDPAVAAKNLVRQFEAGDFAVINSGKIIVGKGLYVPVSGDSMRFTPIAQLVSAKNAADDLLGLLSENEPSDVLIECEDMPPLPQHLLDFCELATKETHEGKLAVAAFDAIFSEQSVPAPPEEIILGA